MRSLSDETQNFSFLEKLIYVIENGSIDFWEDRTNPPNLTVDEFRQVMSRVFEVENLKWISRESFSGVYGRTGEEKCFKFNCVAEFGGIFGIETKYYFVKGYFFDKENLIGVTIQSFRQN